MAFLDKEKNRAYQREWWQKHKATLLAKRNARRASDPTWLARRRHDQALYRDRHRELVNEKSRAYKRANREKVNHYKREWRKRKRECVSDESKFFDLNKWYEKNPKIHLMLEFHFLNLKIKKLIAEQRIKRRDYQKRRRANESDALKNRRREWARNNSQKCRAYTKRSRMRSKQTSHFLSVLSTAANSTAVQSNN